MLNGCRLVEQAPAVPIRTSTAISCWPRPLATYQNGNPTAVIGPPTAGARVLNEFWRDALGAEWVCTVVGTPGTWIQIRPAAVTADPASGMIPAGTCGRSRRRKGAVRSTSQPISDRPTQVQVQAVNDGLVAAITLLNEFRAAAVEKGGQGRGVALGDGPLHRHIGTTASSSDTTCFPLMKPLIVWESGAWLLLPIRRHPSRCPKSEFQTLPACPPDGEQSGLTFAQHFAHDSSLLLK